MMTDASDGMIGMDHSRYALSIYSLSLKHLLLAIVADRILGYLDHILPDIWHCPIWHCFGL